MFELVFGQADSVTKAVATVPPTDIVMNVGVVTNNPSVFVSQNGSNTVTPITLSLSAGGVGNPADWATMTNSSTPRTFYAYGASLSGQVINEALMLMPAVYGSVPGNFPGVEDCLISFTYKGNTYKAAGYYATLPDHWLKYGTDSTGYFSGIAYIMFVPASVVGKNFTYLVTPRNHYPGLNAPSMVDPRSRSSAADWMADPFNTEINSMIAVASANSGVDQATVGGYFYNYLTKYASTAPNSALGIDFIVDPLGSTDPLGDTGSCDYRCFLVVGMNEDVDLTNASGLTSLVVAANLQNTTYQYDPDLVNYGANSHDTLEVDGTPPVVFETSVLR